MPGTDLRDTEFSNALVKEPSQMLRLRRLTILKTKRKINDDDVGEAVENRKLKDPN